MSFKERTDERRAYCQAGCAFLLSPSLPGGCWPLQEAASTSSKSHCGPSVSLNAVGAWVAAETKPFLLLALHSGYIMPAAAAGGGGAGAQPALRAAPHPGTCLRTPTPLALSLPIHVHPSAMCLKAGV